MATSAGTSRRALLSAGVGAVAAAVATVIGRPIAARAASGDPGVIGVTNQSTSPTTFAMEPVPGGGTFPALIALNQAGGAGISGISGPSTGVDGSSTSGDGVRGVSDTGKGVEGRSNTGLGVYGYSNASDGVHGYSGAGHGVSGYTASTRSDAGVLGQSDSAQSYGVKAENLGTKSAAVMAGQHYGIAASVPAGNAPNGRPFVAVAALAPANGLGLFVSGRARFGRSGQAVLPMNRSSLDVAAPGGLQAESLVLAVLMKNRPGVYVQAVTPNPTAGTFRIYLNRVASSSSSTPIAWFIVN